MDFLNQLLHSDVALQLIFLVFACLVLLFVLVQTFLNHKARIKIMSQIVDVQEKMIKNASESLAKDLMNYTDSHLASSVQEHYEQLISKDLLPSLNSAAQEISGLSRLVVERQETGMAELAQKLAELFTQKTREYFTQEAAVAGALQESANLFAEKLTGVNQTADLLNAQYQDIYQKAYTVSQTVSEAVNSLGGGLSGLSAALERTSALVEGMQDNLSESSGTIQLILQSAAKMQELSSGTAELISAQQASTALQLKEAVDSMRQHTEASAQSVLDEFRASLSSSNNAMGETIAALREVAAGMNQTAAHFSGGISEAYNRFSESVEAKLSQASEIFGKSAEQEYEKILAGAEACSHSFTRDIQKLSETFEAHLANLQTITRHLSNTVDSFKSDVDDSSARFELGIDKTVSKALQEMDSSLAEIVRRLVAVTESISEAADALPRAVLSMKESK